ncbi:MAG TPA: DUF2905 domain-containing protein [Acidimicrobiia bacterium]|nr:DUF2905 domain-containing protein [Acidimicrobiia bacterium]
MRAGTVVMWLGVVLVAVGAALRFAPWMLSWFGNLPGDIRHQGERTSVYIPITSMLLISIVGSLLLSFFFRRGG